MERTRVRAAAGDTAWDIVMRLGVADGGATHPHARRLTSSDASPRDLCDAVHLLCAIHGQHPGLAAIAAVQATQVEARGWLEQVADAMTVERAAMVAVSAATGAQPSTPGQAASAAALATSRTAMETLVRSERRGCATGAVAALVHDWRTLRCVFELAATRAGVAMPPPRFPAIVDTAAAISTLGASAETERAIAFGAGQLFHQHRGLWDLLETRAGARIR